MPLPVTPRRTDSVQTIAVAGANLFVLAEQYLGSATQWNRIAALNGLWDFMVSGPTTLKIPPYKPSADNGGVLGV